MDKPTRQHNKVLVIGIDGGTFNVLSPMVEEGQLPNLGKFIKDGVHGELLSTIPPVTSPAWSSFITGTNPGKHGVYGFFKRDLSNYELDSVDTLMNLRTMQGIPFWRVFNKYGKKVGLINIPLTYPPDKVDGFMLSGMLVPEGAGDYYYPPEIRAELDGYQVDLAGLRENNGWNVRNLVMADREGYIQKVFRMTEIRASHALKLLQKHEWDFSMVVFTGSDRMCHHFWTDAETGEGPSTLIKKYYRFLDEKIGALIDCAGEQTVRIVLSDHGFGKAAEKSVNGFSLIKELGYPAVGLKEKFRLLTNKFSRKLGHSSKKVTPGENYWKKCRVFPVPMYSNFLGLCINTINEKKWGIVQPGDEYDNLVNDFMVKLKTLKDNQTGEQIVTAIFRREDLYSGPRLTQAPDLIIQFSYDYQVVFRPLRRQLIESITPPRTGDHRREGIFMACGPGIAPKSIKRTLELTDVTRTLFSLLEIPCPANYEGSLIHELLDENFQEYQTDNDLGELSLERDQHRDNSDEDFEKSKELLENLGYM